MTHGFLRKLLLIAATAACTAIAAAQTPPKRELRGVWMPTVTGEYMGRGEKEMKAKLTRELDTMARLGINAVFFQVRPEADAWYESRFEPWSRFITGTQGRDPGWDPLEFMVDECHKRCIELHAWINPYRVRTSQATRLDRRHIANRHPGMFMDYGGQTFFNPALSESREFICNVVKDIATRYDIDAIHMDDYFYPYPKAGEQLPDYYDFKERGRGFADIGDWRRDNVNKLVKQIRDTIDSAAPWVQLGISPFGIYRNEASDPRGSKTRGLQNYDDLYADILLWVEQGWLDYVAPQLYWEVGHPAADYGELLGWWSDNVPEGCLLYIGQDVARSVRGENQQRDKLDGLRAEGRVDGYCLYPVKEVMANTGGYADVLAADYNATPALPPVARRFEGMRPAKPRKARVIDTSDGKVLFWRTKKVKDCFKQPVKYCVYRFDRKKDINLGSPLAIVAVTSDTHVRLEEGTGGRRKKQFYVITAIDRFNNESARMVKKVKL
ncbi:MAG TPA: family 10 glycosylhydrolase [Candidatus Avibacteroides faecavium]|nr:family 10 glycosylhydrolase [Candidatus Avibacteroides faecavium]